MKIASFICVQQRISSSLYCFTYTGFQRQKQAGVSLNKLILYWGGGIYARTKIKPSIIKAAKTQIKNQGTFFFNQCLWTSVLPISRHVSPPYIHAPFPSFMFPVTSFL
ncbi:unnamed protein product [Rangifer tarandus platyrhynchus]|uniref:Uncharacterized protein n=2 Tax=Rangifer tarandus platyrhynchus TaxID=3082113 RepID=A0AC60A7V9_RANTA|nr:unnamed protein product [Rangifer tarandus platyrhynchus]